MLNVVPAISETFEASGCFLFGLGLFAFGLGSAFLGGLGFFSADFLEGFATFFFGFRALISGLADFSVKIEEPVPTPQRFQTDPSFQDTKEVIAEVKRYLRDYWQCLR